MARIDHLMWAARDLDTGITWATETFGVAPAHGGSHVGLGTRNALLSLGRVYLEIIAPDPAQTLDGTLGERIAALREDGLATWCASANLNRQAEQFAQRSINCRGPQKTQRATTDGNLLIWELLFPATAPFGGCMPFFIDWLECAHPSTTNPVGGRFDELRIEHAQGADLAAALAEVPEQVRIASGNLAGLTATVTTATGVVELHSSSETIELF